MPILLEENCPACKKRLSIYAQQESVPRLGAWVQFSCPLCHKTIALGCGAVILEQPIPDPLPPGAIVVPPIED